VSAAIGGVHWESPIVAAGRLYVTDEAGKLWAFVPTRRRSSSSPCLPAG